MQQAQIQIQEITFKHKENPSTFEGSQTLEHVSQRGCGVFIPGDVQNPTGQGLELL